MKPRRRWTPAELQVLQGHTDPRAAYAALIAAGFSRCINSVRRRLEVQARKARSAR